MHSCPRCNGRLYKSGFLKKERTQRYHCTNCRRYCSDASKRVFGTLRSNPETITLVIRLLTEGMSVRGAARLANCHRDTVLRILKHAGMRSYDLLKRKLVDLPVKHVQADEIHTTVFKKSEFNTDPEGDQNPWGDFYIFLGLTENKMLLMPTIGKRTYNNTERFSEDIARSTKGRFQLTTDGFKPYKVAMQKAMPGRIDFAQYYKEYNMLEANSRKTKTHKRFMKDSAYRYVIRCGEPDLTAITTSHVERVNLSLRTSNRRFNRKTICFSKDEEYLALSVYLFVAAYNFCTYNSALGRKTTPAMAHGLASEPFSVEKLLDVRT